MKNYFSGFLCLLFLGSGSLLAQTGSIQSFPLTRVQLLDGPFRDAQQTDMKYILSLDPDRLLAPFQIDAGIEPKEPRYPNWENTGLDGHIGGHYLSALSNMYAATGEPELKNRLSYMIDKLDECQRKNGDGYVGGIPGGQLMWKEISKGKIDAHDFSLNDKWVPLYNIHKLFAGLRDAYLIGENPKALQILVGLADWFMATTSKLTDDQIQEMLTSEQGGLNEVFADLSLITGANKYLELAKRLSHQALLRPLMAGEDKLTGLHANMQIPKVVGFERIANLTGDSTWDIAAAFFWNTVVHTRTVSFGGNSVREHFNAPDDFSSMLASVQGPETCNTYNMLRLTKLLFLNHVDGKFIDYYERALYNHILSSQHPGEGGFVYYTPIRPMHYRVYSTSQQSFWCCVGTGLENHGKYGELIYAHQGNNLFINLFIASVLNWSEAGITLRQKTRFPYEETSEIDVSLKKPQRFSIYIRKPNWATGGKFGIYVNNKLQGLTETQQSYVTLNRLWKNNDVISIQLPMHTSVEFLPGTTDWVSFLHGPIVLAAATDTTDMPGLYADDSRNGHIASGKEYTLDSAPEIITSKDSLTTMIKPVKGKPLHFTASELIEPDKYKNLTLVPFYTIHDSRYMLYWKVASQ